MSRLIAIDTSALGAVGLVNRDGVDMPPIGNEGGDNFYDPDGYRWHDAFHLANLTVLGCSPGVRALLKRKRRSDPLVDNVEDGGLAYCPC